MCDEARRAAPREVKLIERQLDDVATEPPKDRVRVRGSRAGDDRAVHLDDVGREPQRLVVGNRMNRRERLALEELLEPRERVRIKGFATDQRGAVREHCHCGVEVVEVRIAQPE